VTYRGQLVVVEPGGSQGDAAPASIEVGDEAVTVVPERGDPVDLPFIDLDDVWDDDYTLRLTDFTGRRYDLSMLGKAYGQVLADVTRRRNDRLQHDLLLTGINLHDTFPGRVFPGGGAESVRCEIRLFEDLMVVVPERGLMWGLPYSFVEEVRFDEELYQTHVLADDGGEHVFGMLGKRSEEFPKKLRKLLDALAARTARTLGLLVGGLERAVLSRLAAAMRDGRAVQQRAVDAIAPEAWARLEEAVVGTPDLRQAYERMKALCPPGWAALGVKAVLTESEDSGPGTDLPEYRTAGPATERQGHLEQTRDSDAALRAERRAGAGMPPGVASMLQQVQQQMSGAASAAAAEAARAAVAEAMAAMPGAVAPSGSAVPAGGDAQAVGDAQGVEGVGEDESGRDQTILWFFTPFARDGRPVNAVGQEITSEEGHATYVFRLMEPGEFAAAEGAGPEALAGAVAAAVARLNRALLTLNFRREPIYLPDDQIASGRSARYRAALRRLDYLQWTRRAFLGRAIHNATWERQLLDLIARA